MKLTRQPRKKILIYISLLCVLTCSKKVDSKWRDLTIDEANFDVHSKKVDSKWMDLTIDERLFIDSLDGNTVVIKNIFNVANFDVHSLTMISLNWNDVYDILAENLNMGNMQDFEIIFKGVISNREKELINSLKLPFNPKLLGLKGSIYNAKKFFDRMVPVIEKKLVLNECRNLDNGDLLARLHGVGMDGNRKTHILSFNSLQLMVQRRDFDSIVEDMKDVKVQIYDCVRMEESGEIMYLIPLIEMLKNE